MRCACILHWPLINLTQKAPIFFHKSATIVTIVQIFPCLNESTFHNAGIGVQLILQIFCGSVSIPSKHEFRTILFADFVQSHPHLKDKYSQTIFFVFTWFLVIHFLQLVIFIYVFCLKSLRFK